MKSSQRWSILYWTWKSHVSRRISSNWLLRKRGKRDTYLGSLLLSKIACFPPRQWLAFNQFLHATLPPCNSSPDEWREEESEVADAGSGRTHSFECKCTFVTSWGPHSFLIVAAVVSLRLFLSYNFYHYCSLLYVQLQLLIQFEVWSFFFCTSFCVFVSCSTVQKFSQHGGYHGRGFHEQCLEAQGRRRYICAGTTEETGEKDI